MYEDSLPRRLSFLLLSILFAANLALITYIIAAPKDRAMTVAQLVSLPDNIHLGRKRTYMRLDKLLHTSTNDVSETAGSIMRGISQVPGHISKFAVAAVSINTYIRPANYTDLPVITPLAPVQSIAVVHRPALPPAPTPAAASPAPATVATYQAGAVNAAASNSPSLAIAEDEYAWGNCTRWVAIQRAEINDPIPGNWGNAATWAELAAADGYAVDHHPTPGAIMQTADSAGGLGHVAFVTSVAPDGTWHISEMNVLGLDVVDYRTMPLAAAADYYFIHDKA